MRTRDYYSTDVVTAPLDANAAELAGRMGDYAVGCVVIVDESDRPVGIVTDRDLTCRVIARGDWGKLRAAEIMSRPLVTATADDPIERVVERMRSAGVRRVVVLREGRLSGLVSMDDLVVELGRELDDIGEAARRGVESGRRRGQRERRRGEMEETLAELRSSVERAGRDVADFLAREFESLRERVRRPPGPSSSGTGAETPPRDRPGDGP
jgi:CBS domain-containing protein